VCYGFFDSVHSVLKTPLFSAAQTLLFTDLITQWLYQKLYIDISAKFGSACATVFNFVDV
jgi:hypothetical protein